MKVNNLYIKASSIEKKVNTKEKATKAIAAEAKATKSVAIEAKDAKAVATEAKATEAIAAEAKATKAVATEAKDAKAVATEAEAIVTETEGVQPEKSSNLPGYVYFFYLHPFDFCYITFDQNKAYAIKRINSSHKVSYGLIFI